MAEGLLRSQVGSGTYVNDSVPPPPENQIAPDAGTVMPGLARLSTNASDQFFPRLSHPEEPRAFVTGMPAFDAFPMALWARLAARHWRNPRNAILRYPDPCGLPELRRAVSLHLRANRGISCAPEDVFIFNGAQDAFNRIGNTLLDPGDTVWFENPGAIGPRNSLISCGARLVPVPVDSQGLNVRAGLAAAPDFRLAFVTPAHQHPLGITMSATRRIELLRAAEQAGAWIIEDDFVGEFHHRTQVPPLKNTDTSGRVIYVGSFSKSLFPAARIGYVVTPPKLTPIFQRIAGATLQGAPSSMQSIIADFINEGHFATHIRRMRDIYAERHAALITEAARELPGLLAVRPTDTGLQTVGDILVPGLNDVSLARAAQDAGIETTAISRFAIAPITRQAITLGFSTVPPAKIARGVKTLGVVLRALAEKR